jgi:hypothetical protein
LSITGDNLAINTLIEGERPAINEVIVAIERRLDRENK